MSLESPDPIPSFTFPKIKKQYIYIGVIVLLALIPSIYFYFKYQSAQNKLSNPTQFASDEAKNLVLMV